MMEIFYESSELLEVDDSNEETINIRKHNKKKSKSNHNVIEKHMLSCSMDSSQDTGFSLSHRQRDATEGSSTVLDLVNFVDKVTVLVPNRLGESYSCTTGSIFRTLDSRKKRYRLHSNENGNAKKRFSSNYNMSKRRSHMLRTILNTKFTQSTPSQCTFNFKTSGTRQSPKINDINFIESEKQPIKYLTRAREQFKVDVQHQTDIMLKLEQALHSKMNHGLTKQGTSKDATQNNRITKGRNDFCFSRLGSKSKDSNTGVISSDVLNNFYVTELKNEVSLEKPKKNIFGKKHDRNQTYNITICESDLFVKPASSSLVTVCSVNKTCKLHNYYNNTWNALEVHNMEGKGHTESRIECISKKIRHSSKIDLQVRHENSWMKPRKNKNADLHLAEKLVSHKTKNDANTLCELKCGFSLLNEKYSNENNSCMNLSIKSCYSKETWIPTTIKKEKQIKRFKLSTYNKLHNIVSNFKHDNLSDTDFNIRNGNKRAFPKDNPNELSEIESSIIVSMDEIERLVKNNQAKVIGPKGRRMRCKDVDIEYQSNMKQDQLLSKSAKTTTPNCKETVVNNIFITTNKEISKWNTKYAKSKGVNEFRTDTKSSTAIIHNKPFSLFNSLAKCFTLFGKKEKEIKKEIVNTCTDVPSFYKCNASEITTEICNDNMLYSLSNKKRINKMSTMKRLQVLNKLHTYKLFKNNSSTRNTPSTAGNDELIKYVDNNEENYRHKHSGINHKLNIDLSSFHFLNKYLNKCIKNTSTLNVNCFDAQNSGSTKETEAQFGCSLPQKYDSEINKFVHTGKELPRDPQSPLSYNFLYCRPPPSENINLNKQRKHHHDRCEFEQNQCSSSLSDTPSYNFNKYNFSEDEIICKAIRTAIENQMLKRSQLKLNKHYIKRKHKKSTSQHFSRNTFSTRFYALNVHDLKPYECEPGVCVPDVETCDPHECIKLINKRYKKSASTATTSGVNSVSSSKSSKRPRKHYKQGHHPRPPREQSTITYASRKRSTPAGVVYTKHAKKPSKKKQAVRMGSSFSFNVEFSKGKSVGSLISKSQKEERSRKQKKHERKEKEKQKHETKEKEKQKHERKENEKQKHERKDKEKQKAAGRTKYKHKSSSTTTSDPNKHAKLKRCFCTVKLQKGDQADQIANTRKTNKRHGRRNLDPHECEPYVCIPGRCDPKECLKRIKYRDRGFNAEPIGHHTSSSGTRPAKTKTKTKLKEGPIQTSLDKSKRKHRERRVLDKRAPREHLKSDIAPNKQAVKIGSTFSFSLEFYKNLEPPVIEIKPDLIRKPAVGKNAKDRSERSLLSKSPQEIKGRKVGGRGRSTANSMITGYGVDRGSEPRSIPRRRRRRTDVYGLKDRGVESRLGSRSESRGTGTLRRCFCTLKLHKEGHVPAGQVRLVKHHGTASGKYKEEADCYSKGANTRKLLPYECEPGICIPGECDPYECDKRIQARYCKQMGTTTLKRRIPVSQSTINVYKHAQSGTKRTKLPRSSRGQGRHRDDRDVAQSVETIIHEPRYRPILRKTRQVVRLGSDFKFNIEFFKDKVEHKTERIPPPPPSNRSKSWFSRKSIETVYITPEPKGRGKSWLNRRPNKEQRKASKVQSVISRRSYVKRSSAYKAPPFGKVICKCPEVICKCPEEKQPAELQSSATPAKKPGKRTKKSQLNPKHHATTVTSEKQPAELQSSATPAKKPGKRTKKLKNNPKHHATTVTSQAKRNESVMTTLKRCFCTLSLKNRGKTQTVFTSFLNKYEDPYHYTVKRRTTNAITDHDRRNFYSPSKIYQCHNETKSLLKEVLDQPQPSSLYRKHFISKIDNEKLPYIDSHLFSEGSQLSSNKWAPVTGFLSYCQKSICAMVVDTNTCGPKTCKAKPCNLANCTKKAKNYQEDSKTLRYIKSPTEEQLNVTKSKKSKVDKKQSDRVKQSLQIERSDRATFKDKNNTNRFLSTQRTIPSAKYRKEYHEQSKVVEESRFKSINDPFRQAVRISSSFTFNLEFRRDKLPDDLKSQYDYVSEQKYPTGIKVQTRRHRPQATEKSIGCGPSKDRWMKVDMHNRNGRELKHKKISCDLPFEPLIADVGVSTNNKYKIAPFECDSMCDPDYCTCSTRKRSTDKRSKKVRRGSFLHKRESVQIGSKVSCNVEFFKDRNYSLGPNKKGAGQYSNNAYQPKQSISKVGSALKKCFCALKFQKQIVNYLSIDTKLAHKLEHSKVAEKNGWHRNCRLRKEDVPNESLRSYSCQMSDARNLENQIKQSEMETIYPYVPNKFNKTSVQKKFNERKVREFDYSEHQKRKCRRHQNTVEERKTTKSQNIFLELLVQKKRIGLINRVINLVETKYKPVSLFENMQTSRKQKQKVTSMITKKPSITACRSITQPKDTRETLKGSKSDRRPIKSKLTIYQKKSESSRRIIEKMQNIRKKRPTVQNLKVYSHYQSGDADDECIKNVSHQTSSHLEDITSENLKAKITPRLIPYMDNKLVYVTLVEQPNNIKNKPGKVFIANEQGIEQYQGQYQQYEIESKIEDRAKMKQGQHQQYEIESKIEQTKKIKPIINPKRIYYKLKYPHETLALKKLQPSPLTALANRMTTRFSYCPLCKSNRYLASMLTAIDGKERNVPKSKDMEPKREIKCSLFKSTLRKMPFLSLVSLGKNGLEFLLFGLAVLVCSPCILAVELARALMCCTTCTS